jgi:hypothetical protein
MWGGNTVCPSSGKRADSDEINDIFSLTSTAVMLPNALVEWLLVLVGSGEGVLVWLVALLLVDTA